MSPRLASPLGKLWNYVCDRYAQRRSNRYEREYRRAQEPRKLNIERLEPREMLAADFGEVGILSFEQANSGAWQTVDMAREYINPVVIAGPLSTNGSDPAMVRVANVRAQERKFDVQIDEWLYLDGYHTTETFAYMVIEAGTHELTDGTVLQAGTLDMNLDRELNQEWFTQSFRDDDGQSPFSVKPIVISQLASFNGPDPAVLQQRDITTNDFELKLREEEKRDNWHVTETVGYLAIEPGKGRTGTTPFVAGRTGNNVTHNWRGISFDDWVKESVAFLAALQTTDGSDTANIRYRDLSDSGVQIQIDEETSKDKETKHTTEDVGYLTWQVNSSGPTILYSVPEITLTKEFVGEVNEDGTIMEDKGQAIFRVTRTGSTLDPLAVNLRVAGDATLDVDYSLTGGTLIDGNWTVVIPAQSNHAIIELNSNADLLEEPNEDVELTLVDRLDSGEVSYVFSTDDASQAVTIDNQEYKMLVILDITDEAHQHFDSTLEGSGPPPEEGEEEPNPFNLTQEDIDAFEAAREIWIMGIGAASVPADADSYAEFEVYVTAAEQQLAATRAAADQLQAILADAAAHTKQAYLDQLEIATRAYDTYLRKYQEAVIAQGQFLGVQYWTSAADQLLIDRAFALPLGVDGIEADLTAEQWVDVQETTQAVGEQVSGMIDTLDTIQGGFEGARNALLVGTVVVAAVAFLPATVTLVAGAGILTVSGAIVARTRWDADQSAIEITTGTAADLTGINAIHMSITETDLATGETVKLTPNERGKLFGAGTTSLALAFATAGSTGPTTSVQVPKPVVIPGAQIANTSIVTPATIGFETATVSIATQATGVSTAIVGATPVTVYMTAHGGKTPPEGTEPVGKPRSAYEAGEQLGKQFAKEELALSEPPTPWVNPRGMRGNYGQGIDDIMIDEDGVYWVLEYKGGDGALKGDQMSRQWIQRKIREFKEFDPDFPWIDILQTELDAGRLRGLEIHTEYVNGTAGATTARTPFNYAPEF